MRPEYTAWDWQNILPRLWRFCQGVIDPPRNYSMQPWRLLSSLVSRLIHKINAPQKDQGTCILHHLAKYNHIVEGFNYGLIRHFLGLGISRDTGFLESSVIPRYFWTLNTLYNWISLLLNGLNQPPICKPRRPPNGLIVMALGTKHEITYFRAIARVSVSSSRSRIEGII